MAQMARGSAADARKHASVKLLMNMHVSRGTRYEFAVVYM